MRNFIIILSLFLCSIAYATTPSLLSNNEPVTAEATAPNPLSLLGQWWRYVDIKHENLAERVQYVKETLGKSIESANPNLKLELNNIIQQINASLDGLVAIKSSIVEEPVPINTNKSFYTIGELEFLLDEYQINNGKKLQLNAVQRDEEAIAKKAEQKADETLLIYRDLEGNTERKLRLGMALMANRLSWYLWKAQAPIRAESYALLTSHLELILAEIEYASTRLQVDEETINQIDRKINKQVSLIDGLHRKTIREKDKYTGLIGLDFMSRIEEKMLGQRIVISEISEKQAEANLALLKMIKSLVYVSEHSNLARDFDLIEQLNAGKSINKEIGILSKKWRESTTEERDSIQELLASGYQPQDNQQAQTIIDNRINAVKETLQEITKLEKSTFELTTLISLLEKRLGKTEGWLFKLKSISTLVFDKTGGKIWELLNSKLFEMGNTPVTTWDLIQAILILFVTFYIARIIQRSLIQINVSNTGKIPPAIYTLSRVIFYIINVLGVFIAFSSIGVNFTNLAIVAGALSVGIGFGLQSIVNNFVSGIIILFEHNIKIGDFIELDTGLKGTVRDINVRSTIVNTLDNLDIIVPNSELVTAKVTNYTLNEPIVRIHVPFGVAYGSDKELVRQVVLEACRKV